MEEKNNRNTKQDIAIARIEEKLNNLEKRFEDFVSNEFRHLQNKVDSLEEKIVFGFIVMIGASLILQIILHFLK